mgnify:CR=1 FL=1
MIVSEFRKPDILKVINRLLGAKGDIIKVKFSVGERCYEVLVPDDKYWGSIKDILLNREYEYIPMFHIENLKGKVVIDAGAQVGLYSLIAAIYAKKVISIEPHPIYYRLLEINRLINNAWNITPINAAIVGTHTEQNVMLYESTRGSVAIIISNENLISKCYNVSATTLKIVLEEYIEQEDRVMLKIDVEGAEFDIFKTLDLTLLKHIEGIVGEIHLRSGNFDLITEKLRSAGFQIKYFHLPLIAKSASPRIELKDLLKLKILRSIVYSLTSISRFKDRNLIILFAWREPMKGD